MYISLLDFLKEIKSKFYIIIGFLIVFLVVTYSFNAYKRNFYTISVQTNLLKLSTLTLKAYNLQTNTNTAIRWIGDDTQIRFDKKNKYDHLKLKCNAEDHFLKCSLSGNFDNNVDEVKENLFNSLDGAFSAYEEYFTNLIDGLIRSNEELLEYVIDGDPSEVSLHAQYKAFVSEAIFSKEVLLIALNESRPKLFDIKAKKYKSKINYILVLLSAVICSLFVIFLQMKVNSRDN